MLNNRLIILKALEAYRSNVNGTGRFAKGILNDCQIYNVALTDEQIEEFLLS